MNDTVEDREKSYGTAKEEAVAGIREGMTEVEAFTLEPVKGFAEVIRNTTPDWGAVFNSGSDDSFVNVELGRR